MLRWLATSALIIALATSMVRPAIAAPKPTRSAALKAQYVEASRRIDLDDFAGALSLFEQLYLQTEDPVLLFDIGQCYRHLNRREDAIRTFKLYLRKAPKAKNAESVRRIINSLKNSTKDDAAATASTSTSPTARTPSLPEPPPLPVDAANGANQNLTSAVAAQDRSEPRRAGRGKVIAGIIVGVIGIGAVATGVGLQFSAMQADQQLNSLGKGDRYNPALYNRSQDLHLAAPILLAAGGAAIITGIIVTAIGSRQLHRSRLNAISNFVGSRVAFESTLSF